MTSRRDSATLCPSAPRDERRQLEQLEVAHDRVRDVEVGVEAQLAQPPAGARGPLQQLVAQQPVGGVQRLGGAEQLLLALLPRRRRARRAPSRAPASGASGAPRSSARGIRQHQPRAGSAQGHVQLLGQRRMAGLLAVGRKLLGHQRVRDALGRGHGHAGVQPDHVDVVGLQPARRAEGQHLHRRRRRPARAPPARAARSRRRRRSSGRTRAAWPGACASRRRRPARRSWPGRAGAPPHLTAQRTAAGGAARAARSAGGRRGRGGSCRSRSCRPCRA